MTFDEIRSELTDANEEALLADGFEEALVGHVSRFGDREPIALYDREKCIEILMKRDRMSYEGASEFFEFNVAGSWVGKGTPAFAVILRDVSPKTR